MNVVAGDNGDGLEGIGDRVKAHDSIGLLLWVSDFLVLKGGHHGREVEVVLAGVGDCLRREDTGDEGLGSYDTQLSL